MPGDSERKKTQGSQSTERFLNRVLGLVAPYRGREEKDRVKFVGAEWEKFPAKRCKEKRERKVGSLWVDRDGLRAKKTRGGERRQGWLCCAI